VFFDGLGHMGIYIGNEQFVHAPHTGDVVKISSLSNYGGYVGAVRISG
jgi:cell wall-associated NlpC family hydrolase